MHKVSAVNVLQREGFALKDVKENIRISNRGGWRPAATALGDTKERNEVENEHDLMSKLRTSHDRQSTLCAISSLHSCAMH